MRDVQNTRAWKLFVAERIFYLEKNEQTPVSGGDESLLFFFAHCKSNVKKESP